jgi:hypothetical protein
VAALLAHVLPLAVIGALMPTRLAMVAVLLGSHRPRANAIAFSVACTAGYLAVALLSGVARTAASRLVGVAPHSLAPLELLLGLGFLAVLALTLLRRPRSRTGSSRLAERLGGIRPQRAALMGLGLGALSLRNVALLLEVATLAVESGLGRTVLVGMLSLTVLIFSLPMLLPIAAYLLVSDRIMPFLASARASLERNAHWITVVVTGLLGAYLTARGALGLFSFSAPGSY